MTMKQKDFLYYKATDSRGQDHRLQCRTKRCCCLIVHPAPIDSIFRKSTAEFYSSEGQCENHAADWRRQGYEADVVPAIEITSDEYAAIVPLYLIVHRVGLHDHTPDV
jgi:hypothetical protein